MLEVVEQVGGHLQAEAGLARAARAGQGHQPYARAQQQVPQRGDLLLATDQRGRLHGQVVRTRVEALEGREVRGEPLDDQLEDTLWLAEVFEAVLTQITKVHLRRWLVADKDVRRL